jgi:hypothetical protein
MEGRKSLAIWMSRMATFCALGLIVFSLNCAGDINVTLGDAGNGPGDAPIQKTDSGESDTTSSTQDSSVSEDSVNPECPPEGLMPEQCPCENNSDCESSFCVQAAEGKICAEPCIQECPDGWNCELVSGFGADLLYLCVPKNVNLCRPCQSNSDCKDIYFEQGERCVSYGDFGSFCGVACGAGCPEGTSCQNSVDVDGTGVEQCVSNTGECECSALAIQQGAITDCKMTSAAGSCDGTKKCLSGGLSECNATSSIAEICDGLDNNCDGIIDGNQQSCDSECGMGTQTCTAGDWGACVSPEPITCTDYTTCTETQICEPTCPPAPVETCNGLDDNCNNTVDEGFECKIGDMLDKPCSDQCGVQSFVCSSDCEWKEMGSCVTQGECTPGTEETAPCGNCGTKTRSCSAGCGWGAWTSCSAEKSCSPATTESQACGTCGTQTRSCNSECEWDAFGSCTESGTCTPGQSETQACGQCGTQSRTCNNQCQWDGFGQCSGQGACTPGQSETQACGQCGTQSRTCNNQCQWDGFGQCSGQGACSLGQSETQACGQCGTQSRTCNNQCQWDGFGQCSGQGACSPGQTQACGCGTQTCDAQCQWSACPNECKWYEECVANSCKLKNPLPYLHSPGPSIPAAFMAPVNYTGKFLLPKMGSGDPHWYHTQWGNPLEVNPGAANSQGGGGVCGSGPGEWLKWGVGNPYVSMCWTDNAFGSDFAVQLFANGGPGVPCNKKLDVFLSPTSGNYKDTIETMGLDYGLVQDSPSLAAHSSLKFSFGAQMTYAVVNTYCSAGNSNAPCGGLGKVDYGGVLAAIYLENTVSNQVLFYQIYLYDTRASKGCGPNPCQKGTNWFSPTPIASSAKWFGVTEHIANFSGQSCLKAGENQNYSLNILPSLQKLIASGPSSGAPGLDSNLNNWRVTGLYVGTTALGDVEILSKFHSIDLKGMGSW